MVGKKWVYHASKMWKTNENMDEQGEVNLQNMGWLVVFRLPLWKMMDLKSMWLGLSHILWEKNIPNRQPVYIYIYMGKI